MACFVLISIALGRLASPTHTKGLCSGELRLRAQQEVLMLRRQNGLLATVIALSLAGWVGCGDDDGGSDDGSGTETGSGTESGTGDGGDGSDDGGSGSDDGGTGTGSSSGTGTGSSGTGTGSSGGTGTGSSGTGTGTGSSGTGTGTGSSSGTGTGSVACEDIDDREDCMGTWGCDWEGGGGSGECVPFDGDCSEFGQQHCEAMVECEWIDGDCENA
jgi:hypothetical protein